MAKNSKRDVKEEEERKEESEEDEDEEEAGCDEDSEDEPAATKKVPAKEGFKPPPRGEADAESDSGDDTANDKAEALVKGPPKPVAKAFKPHKEHPEMEGPVDVVYCPTCGLPPDFCQYGPSWEKCKPWCMQNFPQYYPELAGASLEDAKKSAEAAEEKSKVKELPGGKKKREASPHVTIKKLSRGGRKCVTSVTGLEGFGVNLDAAAKVFKKKFSCGVSVVKGEAGQPDSVDIQGDFEDDLIELCQKEYKNIPIEKFSVLEGGTKKKGKGK